MSRPARWLPRWLAAYELGVLLAFVALVAGTWLFSFIAFEVNATGVPDFDRKVLLSMRRPSDLKPIGPPSVQEAARDVTGLGGVTTLTLLTAFTAGYLLLSGKGRMALFVIGSVLGGLLLSNLLKMWFHRPRPDLVPFGSYVSTSSFPSGHSMLSAATYLTLGAILASAHKQKRLKIFFILTAAFLSLLVGISRVYLGVHWPTDVLAGWTAGSCWAILCWLAARWLQIHQAIEQETSGPLPEE